MHAYAKTKNTIIATPKSGSKLGRRFLPLCITSAFPDRNWLHRTRSSNKSDCRDTAPLWQSQRVTSDFDFDPTALMPVLYGERWRVRGRHQADAQKQGVDQQIIGRNPQD